MNNGQRVMEVQQMHQLNIESANKPKMVSFLKYCEI